MNNDWQEYNPEWADKDIHVDSLDAIVIESIADELGIIDREFRFGGSMEITNKVRLASAKCIAQRATLGLIARDEFDEYADSLLMTDNEVKGALLEAYKENVFRIRTDNN